MFTGKVHFPHEDMIIFKAIKHFIIYIGFMYRICQDNSNWDNHINLSECHTVEYMTLHQQATDAYGILTASATDTVEELNMTEIETIVTHLLSLTDPSEIMLPNDLDQAIATIGIVDDVLG